MLPESAPSAVGVKVLRSLPGSATDPTNFYHVAHPGGIVDYVVIPAEDDGMRISILIPILDLFTWLDVKFVRLDPQQIRDIIQRDKTVLARIENVARQKRNSDASCMYLALSDLRE